MQDEEFRELFHRVDLQLERLEAKMDNFEKRLASMQSWFKTRFASIESRLDGKAGNFVVSLWAPHWRCSSRQPSR